jgi:hypothetical protein
MFLVYSVLYNKHREDKDWSKSVHIKSLLEKIINEITEMSKIFQEAKKRE